LQLYWALHFVPGSRTIFEGVRRVQPAEACEIDVISGREIRSWRYWRLQESEERHLSREELADLVEQAVTSRLVADVPVGVYLSGGLDSSLLASLAAQHVPGIHTFSIGFDSAPHDESGYAWEVADYIGATHHHFMFEVNDFRALIPEVIASMDEPVGDQAMLPLFALAREASREVKVALSGEGADELLGGYSYYAPFARPSSAEADLGPLAPRAGEGRFDLLGDEDRTPSGFPLVLRSALRQRLSPPARWRHEAWHEELSAALTATRDPLRRAQLCDIATWLSDDLLMKADKMNMANSLESRSPYLTAALAEAALNLPSQDKVNDHTVKVVLRDVATEHLPRTIFSRPKQGWVLPMKTWLLADLFDDFVAGIRECTEPLIDVSYLHALVRDERRGNGIRIGDRALYTILVLIKWLSFAALEIRETRRIIARVPQGGIHNGAASPTRQMRPISPNSRF
jgi:asparagine synthase (glutamine-hydrolysing)